MSTKKAAEKKVFCNFLRIKIICAHTRGRANILKGKSFDLQRQMVYNNVSWLCKRAQRICKDNLRFFK
ncbi:MAG: hypothetical protein DBX59_02545 [Bacillota bacterium]|nr:MAG: hypothetical protein DBX59_02545 [Bacillota bacterium]